MSERARRHQHIQHVLAAERVLSQQDLQRLLARRGIEVGQPTLSRDLRELGVVKTPHGYRLPGQLAASSTGTPDALAAALRSFVLAADRSGAMLVLRTGPGHAQPVALELDRSPPDGVLGTIAGDDTIFIAARSETHARRALDTIRTLAGLA